MRQSPRLRFAMICLPVVVGCSSILDPTFSEPALLISFGDTAAVAAPAVVTRGLAVEVSVGTLAGGCTRTIARTETKVSGTLAEIRPYNETQRADWCTGDLIVLTHTASIRFDETGAATVRVIGEQTPFEGTGTRRGPAQLERHVVVQ